MLCAKSCNFTKSNNPPCVFSTFFKLNKWCNIAQHTAMYKVAGKIKTIKAICTFYEISRFQGKNVSQALHFQDTSKRNKKIAATTEYAYNTKYTYNTNPRI